MKRTITYRGYGSTNVIKTEDNHALLVNGVRKKTNEICRTHGLTKKSLKRIMKRNRRENEQQ